ncbi:ECF-family RNA polymerase sigma factor [Sorangium cellulosum So ce56]|uniref:ECF-family RNA polymerase sigma factor n=1 Tax=Sorangium cellulosum (strain So ce56) TaxID=448385 RepID=A9GGE5_SORC5|nr:sigma factor [Sorangium cellulosum]CAN96317.1 ECF-family RNA polymerase sigma factor [Sorangium cellulosum So ce56]
MAFPVPSDEIALHERVLARDPVAPVDVFQDLMDPLSSAIRHDLPCCTEDEAYDSSVDAVLAYLGQPEKYDRTRGRLSTYLLDIAKKKSIDRLRARSAAERRDETYAALVEVRGTDPKQTMEAKVEARQLWEMVEGVLPQERDRQAIALILSGESSTDVLAEALGLTGMPAAELRRRVKQHRDRLMKVLERLEARQGHDEGT